MNCISLHHPSTHFHTLLLLSFSTSSLHAYRFFFFSLLSHLFVWLYRLRRSEAEKCSFFDIERLESFKQQWLWESALFYECHFDVVTVELLFRTSRECFISKGRRNGDTLMWNSNFVQLQFGNILSLKVGCLYFDQASLLTQFQAIPLLAIESQ